MKKVVAIIVGLIILAVLLLFSMTYSVSYHEVGIRSRFGKIDESSIIKEPGLHFRLPFFADSVQTFDTRTQLLKSPMDNLQTKDGQQIVVEAFMFWKIDTEGDGPLKFYESFASIGEAPPILESKFRDAVSVLSQYRFSELLGPESRLEQAEGEILSRMQSLEAEGVLPVFAGVSRVVLKEKTSQAVIRRMKARRDTLAENERARGVAEAQRISSEAQTTADKILAFASQRAQEIRTRGEEQAAKYLQQMSQDEDLAIFLIWLDALEQALAENTTVILETDFAPWHLMNIQSPDSTNPIPQPMERIEGGGARVPEGATRP
ncbi:MAG: SPFH domain-containing protein [Planctomycetota bacterium]|nr:SPFH domain-containing protein [Planctomycetota bacterium]|tara:strand:- start:22076 stop:23035 length:960 start_codon:yes stop_codon:yes gene_type:complete